MRLKLKTAALLSTLYAANIFAADSTIISTLTTTPLFTSTDGNIEITSTGRVTVVAPDNAITMDTPNQVVLVDPGNTSFQAPCGTGCAIVTSGAGSTGVYMQEASNGVLIGAMSKISAAGSGILLEKGPATIDNSGIINGGSDNLSPAISVTNTGGTSAVITNELGGTIQGLGIFPTILVASEGLTLNNSGTITNTVATAAAVRFTEDFIAISNSSTGVINSDSSIALDVNGLSFKGNVNNSGTISSNTGTAAYNLSGIFQGTFTNDKSITLASTSLADATVNLSGPFGTFINSATGTISGTDSATGVSILPASTSGTFTNTGTISSKKNNVVLLNGKLDAFTNTGTISITDTTNTNAVVLANNATVTTSFTNSGFITHPTAGQTAIDFGTNANNSITLIQNGFFINDKFTSIIKGNIILASNGSDVLEMNGGQINGNITVAPAATNPNLLTFEGGMVTGDLDVGINQPDIVNIFGGSLQNINGNTGPGVGNTYNVAGGSFTSLTGGTSLQDEMIITEDFTFNGPGDITNLKSITVSGIPGGNPNPSVVFNSDITNLQNKLEVISGSVTLNALLTDNVGSAQLLVQPNGAFVVGSNGLVKLDSADIFGIDILNVKHQMVPGVADNPSMFLNTSYTQDTGSTLEIQIGGLFDYGNIKAADIVVDMGSNIRATLTPIAFIPEASKYPILNAINSLTIPPGYTVRTPASVMVNFRGQQNGNEYDLIAERNLYSRVAQTPNTIAVGLTLDALSSGAGPADPDLRNLLIQLDVLQTAQELTNDINQLMPPMDYGMIEGANIGMDRTFYSIQRRLEDLRGVQEVWAAGYRVVRDEWDGINYGDDCDDDNEVLVGTWAMAYGELLAQKPQKEAPGYQFSGFKGNAVGFAVGMDWNAIQDNILGICASYTKVNIETQNTTSNVQDLNSLQGTFYAFLEPMDALYADFLLGIASSKFQNRRNIVFGNIGTAAFSDFYGLQFGSQFDLGYVLQKYNFYTAPVARMKYTHLALDDYTETGAGGLSLAVQNRSLQEWLVGGGLRFAFQQVYSQARYVPEAEVMYLYAIQNQGLEAVGNFLGGGPAFSVNSNKPGKDIVLVDVGINAHTNDGYVFTGKFEWEWRNHFMAYSGFLQLYHRWG